MISPGATSWRNGPFDRLRTRSRRCGLGQSDAEAGGGAAHDRDDDAAAGAAAEAGAGAEAQRGDAGADGREPASSRRFPGGSDGKVRRHAADRKSVVEGTGGAERLEHGGTRNLKKK